MTYNPYSTPYAQGANAPNQQYNNQGTQSNLFVWVSNEEQARSYPVIPGTSMFLMDSNNSTFYVKSVDLSGMTINFRIFEYSEKTQNAPIATDVSGEYVTREEFNNLQKKIESLSKRNNYKRDNRESDVNA